MQRIDDRAYWLVFEAIEAGVVILDPDGRVLAANGAAADLLGRPREELPALAWPDLTDPRDPRATDLVAKLWRTGRAAAEISLRRGDGGPLEIRARGAVDPGSGTTAVVFLDPLLALGFEARLERSRAILENAADAIVGQSPQGIIVDWNPAAERLYGHSAEEALGRPVGLIVPADRREELASAVEKVERSELVPPFETIRLHRDGRRIDVEVSLSAIPGDGGETAGVASIARPVREPKWVKETLRENQAIRGRLEGVVVAAREVAHRLNNDLTLAVGAFDLLAADDDFPPSLRPLAQKAQGGLEAAITAIRQFQQASRVEKGERSGDAESGSGPSVDSRMRRLLILEDERSIREAIESVLADEGYDVRGAANGEDALALLDNFQPDMILLDMRMPVMDGWQFAAAYRERPGPHAPIIAVTAATSARERAAQIDADGFLAKPFDIPSLLATINRVVG
jgi:two-component system chemotaxis response regulator CheY